VSNFIECAGRAIWCMLTRLCRCGWFNRCAVRRVWQQFSRLNTSVYSAACPAWRVLYCVDCAVRRQS